MRCSVTGFMERLFSLLCSGLPIVIRHSLAALREGLSLQILASLHLLSIVCLSGYLRAKCTRMRKTDQLPDTAEKALSLFHCALIMETKK